MKKKSQHQYTLNLVQIALLSAIVVIIQLFFASVKIGPVTIAFTLIPIVLSGIFVGPWGGLIVGAVSGLVTFIQVFTSADPFYVFLIANNPLATAIICLLKTSLAGFCVGLVYKAIHNIIKSQTLNTIIPAILCPVVNTGIFCAGMLIFFTGAFQSDEVFGALSENIIYFVFIGLAGINFVFELISTAVLAPIISKALFSAKVFKK